MALSISIGTDGRIYNGSDTRGCSIIPPENAGIGDLVYKLTGGSTYKVVGRGATSAPSGYTLYGAIYGFVAGMAMVVAPSDVEGGKTWNANSQAVPSSLPTYGWGTVLMRNGNKSSYAQMNTARQMASDSYRGTAGTLVHPTAAYNGGVMTEATYNSDTNSVKSIYGTWKEYLRQTLRVNGAPGTPFGAVASGVKVHEFGRWATAQLQATSASDFPAANYCYTFQRDDEANGTWWLPSMFELGEMMIDEHLNKLNENNTSLGWSDISVDSYRWSSVLYSSDLAWSYTNYGASYRSGFSYSFAVRPVTLLKLV